MDFELDQDQQMLAKTVADFAKNESPVARFRQFRDDDVGYDPGAWRKMGELGWMAVPFAESAGGLGGSFIDCAIILENLATTLVPEPYLASVILGGMTLARAGNAVQHETYLTPMIEGESTLALAWGEAQSRYDVAAVETTATPDGASYKLSGEKVWVLNGHHAEHLIVSAKAPGGVSLFVVPRDADGVAITVAKTIDGHKAAFIRFDDVVVDENARLGEEGEGAAVLDRTMDYAAAAAVAEGVRIATTMLRMTLDYLGTREQFGVKIGSEHRYGSSRENLRSGEKTQSLLFEVDWKGASRIRQEMEEAVLVFVMTPSLDDLIHRIKERGPISPEELSVRIRTATMEIQKVADFDYLVINDNFDEALNELHSIITVESCKRRHSIPAWRERWEKEIQAQEKGKGRESC